MDLFPLLRQHGGVVCVFCPCCFREDRAAEAAALVKANNALLLERLRRCEPVTVVISS